ncbi:hypothetical protein [Methanococcoides sp. AM1]|uniref:hypothetical protein n=1 Tax=Methanococcoides sp. AM1 TaxID=1201011 RepID=UPI0014385162|nr:hypothetical protein [Methanococcoides sp. AM1]
MPTQTIENRLKKLEEKKTETESPGVYIFDPEEGIPEEVLASGKYMVYLPDNGRDKIE